MTIRLRLASDLGGGTLDGGWWPRTRDLTTELADLVAALDPSLGTVVRVEVSNHDWDEVPKDVVPTDERHTIDLHLSGGTTLRLLVVPPSMTASQGEEALLAAATRGYTHSAAELLETVSEYPDVDPDDRWLG